MERTSEIVLDVEVSTIPKDENHPHLATVVKSWVVNKKYKVLLAITHRITHLRIRRVDDLPITEYEIFQAIKNRFLGENVVAIQVFPRVTDYVNNTNTYHLFTWEGIDVPNLKLMYTYSAKSS